MVTRRQFLQTASAGALFLSISKPLLSQQSEQPNILWIIAEDASPHLSCYGETTIETPNIDRLASEGMRCTNAFVTSPVCSPIRSSLVTGMYQSVIGAHNHRSQRKEGKGAGNPEYLPSYTLPDPIQLIPEYFQDAGYFTVNGGPQNSNFGDVRLGKADYNFVWDISVYDSDDWSDRRNGQPFFAQIQLKGGKKRNAKVNNPVNPEDVTLPPYYPDHPVTRKDWAEYLNSMISMDEDVGEILDRLEEEGLADNTMVVFMTDHGVSHLRGKQFLYDEGIHVPLIIRWPGKISPGRVNENLVLQIDLVPTSLKAAGIPVPQHLQGLDLFDDNITPREHIVATRHRCDETIENMRCVRTNRYKYIRNYYPNRPHLQPNRYKDGKEPTQLYRQLYAEGHLTELQASMLRPQRPAEELYDLQEDPYETVNLIGEHAYQDVLMDLRQRYSEWLTESGDLGLIPEPILEEMGLKYGSKYEINRKAFYKQLLNEIRLVHDIGGLGRAVIPELAERLQSDHAAVRYWSAYILGNQGSSASPAASGLNKALRDSSGGVRVAAARALYRLGSTAAAEEVLLNELQSNPNHVTRHYAAVFIEELEIKTPEVQQAMAEARTDIYEFLQRVAVRYTDDYNQI